MILKDSKSRVARNTEVIDHIIKPLILVIGIIYALISIVHFSHPTIIGAIIATPVCFIVIGLLVWLIKAVRENIKEKAFQKRVASGEAKIVIEPQRDLSASQQTPSEG